ncbi:MAG: hypothetical protein OCU22_04370 [Canidatus Methanoxibalbensis ujae]|nr:hypothetical protein [Candidatus Methanoxibalbensis ujae]
MKEIGEKEETILKSPIENITAGKVIKQPLRRRLGGRGKVLCQN